MSCNQQQKGKEARVQSPARYEARTSTVHTRALFSYFRVCQEQIHENCNPVPFQNQFNFPKSENASINLFFK